MDIHVVRAGDTLYSIGRMHGVAPGLIARYNGLREPYRLAVGQSLLILRPLLTYTVRPGDSLYSIGKQFGVGVRELWRNNPNLSGGTRIYPGQVLVIRLEEKRTRGLDVSGYAYPFVSPAVLRGILPYAAFLAPFTYGISAEGGLVPLDDAALLALAREYGASPLLHLSTLTENGGFSSLRAEQVLLDPERAESLIEETAAMMVRKGYAGVDVDFEFLGAPLAEAYADFVGALRRTIGRLGGIVIAALAPKTSAAQRGVLYEGHDYQKIAANADFVLVMSYGYTQFAHTPECLENQGKMRDSICISRLLDRLFQKAHGKRTIWQRPNRAFSISQTVYARKEVCKWRRLSYQIIFTAMNRKSSATFGFRAC